MEINKLKQIIKEELHIVLTENVSVKTNEENKKPYKDIKVTDKYIIREFNKNIDPIELMWHRDNEDRIVEILGKTDWKIQLDNQLPKSLNEQISIPKHTWHRVIKGTDTLKLKIYKK
tara:strand:+ start:1636 stop:1986 length:351 start_codon:yes stop_codon:yes gene_type:complete